MITLKNCKPKSYEIGKSV